MVVECDFGPLEELQHLFVFVKHTVLKPAFANKFSLFVTPPKRVLRGADLQKSFWDHSMVPGAYVHVSIDTDIYADGLNTEQASQQHIYKEFLQSEVLAAETETVPERVPPPQRGGGEGQGEAAPRRAGGDFASAKSTKVAASGKVPKWFKAGK